MNRISSLKLIARHLSEESKAKAAIIPKANEATVFDKIIQRELPAKIIYEDDLILGFRDVSPKAPTHILLIPKIRGNLINLHHAEEKDKDILGHLLLKAAEIAKKENLDDGWRLVINNGANACQSVYHLHLHILGGKQLTWPPG